MSCYYPKYGYVDIVGIDPDGVPLRKLRFISKDIYDLWRDTPPISHMTGEVLRPMTVGCGLCAGCRNDHAKDWAARSVCEAMMHPNDTCHFVTLTYNDDHLPIGSEGYPTCRIQDMRDFMRDVRDYWKYHFQESGIRYFGVSEYGDKYGRPHYHLNIYGLNIPELDRRWLGNNFRGDPLFTSKIFDHLWPYGYHRVGALTIDSAAYTARYAMKKLKGRAKSYYDERGIEPESQSQSNRPGIGRAYVEAKMSDIYCDGRLDPKCREVSEYGVRYEGVKDKLYLPNGVILKPPRYFDKVYVDHDPNGEFNLALIKDQRLLNGELRLLSELKATNYTEEELLHIKADMMCEAQKKLIRGFERGLM